MALVTLKPRCLSSMTASTVAAGLLLVLGSALRQTHANPLVYPNRFSFQKTTSTSSTPLPVHGHDHSNNSISSTFGSSANESGSPTSRGFRYDIAAWVIGVILFVCFLIILFYPRRKEPIDDDVSSCYVFPPNNDLNLKGDADSTRIISQSS